MKKVKLLLTMAVVVFATMICCSMSAFALTEGDWEFKLLDNQVTITKYIGEGGKVIVPETIAGLPVTNIDSRAFRSNNIKSVEIKTKLNEIPSDLFFDQSNLETAVLPEGIEIIGNGAFWHCNNLKNINIPSTVKNIEADVFCGCSSLKNITLPEGIESIGGRCFESSGITEIDLSNIKTGYRTNAITDTFAWCVNLKSVKLSPYVSEIPERMFIGCTALVNVEIPNGVTVIGNDAFYDCSALKELILPSSLKTIGNRAFQGTDFTEIIIPYGTEHVGGVDPTFARSANLEAIYIPDTVNRMYMKLVASSCPNAIVYCSEGSYAAEHCKNEGHSYLTDNSVNSGIHVYYNGKRISFHSYGQNPELLEGRTLVPLRSIFEAMGADVQWDGATSTAIAKRGNTEVKITIGANEIYKNGKAISVDVPAQLINSRTMVPARVIAEAFGADVQWNGNGRVVLITE